jgi:hypothetical protein
MTLYGTVPSYSFTSREEIERLISLTGNQQWLDDLDDADVVYNTLEDSMTERI